VVNPANPQRDALLGADGIALPKERFR